MTKFMTFAPSVFAGESEMATPVETKTENTVVLSTIERSDLIPVTDQEGNVFYNRYVSADELFDASIDHKIVDTFTYEYQGRTYAQTHNTHNCHTEPYSFKRLHNNGQH